MEPQWDSPQSLNSGLPNLAPMLALRPALILLLTALALSRVALGTHGTTLCHDAAVPPFVDAAVMPAQGARGYGITDVIGQFLLIEVTSPKISHGDIFWTLKDAADGSVITFGIANEFPVPAIVGPIEEEALCLEVTSNVPSERPYALYVVAEDL